MQTSEIKYTIPKSIKKDAVFGFCPGCDHGVAIRLVAEILDELNLREKAIAVASSGCSVYLYDFLDVDCIESPHGRACAVATGIKRGENISVICINNTNYGMTGGQMGPTSTMGQITTTSPMGRNKQYHGFPIKTAEHIALCDGVSYSARVALYDVKNIINAKKAIKKAFEYQLEGLGFSFIEILSSCPTNWKLSPQIAHKRIENELSSIYPIKVFKDIKENINE